jgi:hypothetical protein
MHLPIKIENRRSSHSRPERDKIQDLFLGQYHTTLWQMKTRVVKISSKELEIYLSLFYIYLKILLFMCKRDKIQAMQHLRTNENQTG